MRTKIRILFKFSKIILKRLFSLQISYKGKSVLMIPLYVFRYTKENGISALFSKIKREVVAVALGQQVGGGNLRFPNGLVSGVEKSAIESWASRNKKRSTIIIPSYNDLEYLIPCLKSLKRTTNPKTTKIIIVDDYCQPENSAQLRKLENEQISVIFREQNGGFAKAVATGLAAADKRYDVVLLNSDTVAKEGWLEALQYGAYEFGVDTGVVGPKLLYPDGRIQSAGSYRNTEVPEFFDHYYRFQNSNYGPANVPHYCLAVTGACMYIKREFINYVGNLDEEFQFAFEEVDWCLRGWQKGYRTLYFPSSVLVHNEGVVRKKNKTIGQKEQQSVDYFWKKWSNWFDKRNVRDKNGKIRIIFVLQTMGLSGGIKIVFEHASRLAEAGFAIEVWGLDHKTTPWSDIVSEKIMIRTFTNYERLSNALAHEEAIKVATWWETAFPIWLGSVNKGIPAYFIQEFESWFYPNDIVAQSAVVSCYRKEFKNMTTSKYNLNEIKNLGLKAVAIPCGYDDKTYKVLKNVEREENVILAIGRTFFQKNFNFTFKAWKSLGEYRPDMWLFGIEPHMENMDTKITYFKKPSNEAVNELYNKATIFVQTSRHEGFSLPILEAMAAGCPVICTDAHGNRDFCENGKNCLMVKHDDEEGLARAIRKLMKNKKLREQLSEAGLKTAKKYRWDPVMRKVEKFYNEIAAQ